MTILDSLREMLGKAHEAEGLPAEVEIRLPRQVVLAMCRDELKHRDRFKGEAVIAGPVDGGPYPWLRCFTEWGALFVRPLDATSSESER